MPKIIYAHFSPQPEDLSPEFLAQLKCDALGTIEHVTSSLNLSKKDGSPIAVNVEILTDPDERAMFYNAGASRRGRDRYLIRIGGGVLIYADRIAQLLVADESILKGSRATIIIDDQLAAQPADTIIKSFIFHYLVALLFWHELAHIILGHVDWIYAQRSEAHFLELQTRPLIGEAYGQQQVLEADADRQAASWLLATYDHVIGRNTYLRYRNEVDGFYDFGVAVAAFFRVFEALEAEIPDASRSHPLNVVRIMTSMTGLHEYLQKYRESDAEKFYLACCAGAGSALEILTHRAATHPPEVETILQTFEYGMKIDVMGVRGLRLNVKIGPTSIFVKNGV